VKRAALLCTAFASDLLLGDPHWFPHPVRGFGALAALGERSAKRSRARCLRSLSFPSHMPQRA